jgi:hypothetical protein
MTPSGSFTEFPIPTAASGPLGMTAGPDGNLWFAEVEANQVAMVETDGTITEFPVPTASSRPAFMTAGPDDNVWFTEFAANKIGRITLEAGASCGTTSARCVVDQLYRDLFHRAAEEGGLAFWAPRVGSADGRADAARQIFRSSEGRRTYVRDAYMSVLGRPADPSGLTYWTNRLLGGASETTMLAGLYESNEFFSKSGGTNTGFVNALYQKVLGRSPSASERSDWVAKLNAGATRRSVAVSVLTSLEGLDVRAARWYQRMLGRAATVAERTQGGQVIGLSGEAVLVGRIAATVEYVARAQLDRTI